MPDSVAKVRRQRAILDLVREEPIESQEGLARALRRRGFRVTQATLSRDLKELRVARVPVEGGYRYAPAGEAGQNGGAPEPGRARLRSVAAEEVTGIDANEVGVVIRTLTGRAQGVAVWIDGQHLDDVLGTIAGDDTILVLPRRIRRTATLKKRLADLFAIGA